MTTSTRSGYDYDPQTVDLYKHAINVHKRLAPYIDAQVQRALKTGEPIMQPLFFDFPRTSATYTVTDEWLLGDDVLAAPIVGPGASRDVYLPRGRWVDVNRRRAVRGPTVLHEYAAGLDVTPVFVRPGAREALAAFR